MVAFCPQINPAVPFIHGHMLTLLAYIPAGKQTRAGLSGNISESISTKKAAEAAYFICFFVLFICLLF